MRNVDFQKISNGSRVEIRGRANLHGTVIAKGNTKWVTVRWDDQGFGFRVGQIRAEVANDLNVFARPRPVIEIEARHTTDKIRLAELRHEWRLHRPAVLSG